METNNIRIAVTPGEPAGIGPDITVQMAQRSFPFELVAIADVRMLEERAHLLGLPLLIEEFHGDTEPRPHQAGTLQVIDLSCAERPHCGKLNIANVPYVMDTLRRAATGCLNKEFSGLVTGPVHKGIINDAGISFSGHTEFLAEISKIPHVVMMLITTGLRVALVTTHIPLRDVCDRITPALIEHTLVITHQELQRCFGVAQPNITICGLNPHAGEGGHLGREETEIIIPVLEKLRSRGFSIEGPLPADTAFIPKFLSKTDVFVAMYHDQGLPVLKHAGFGNAVNITLGLPFIRTSVDHGTALELAGTGKADVSSLISAVNIAADMIGNRTTFMRTNMMMRNA